jgi:hypothetical protein
MNDNIDWGEFLKSAFCLNAKLVFDTKDNQSMYRPNGIISYDTSIPSMDKLSKVLNNEEKTLLNKVNVFPIWPSLYYSLFMPTTSGVFKKNIIDQWMSTLRIINQLQAEPILSFLIIGDSGKYLNKHQHFELTKQTVTFQFEFPTFSNLTLPDLKDSSIKLYDENNNVTHELARGKSNKTMFTILDDCKHDAYFKHLKFCWIYDFRDYVDLSKVDFGDFEFLNFSPITDEIINPSLLPTD